MIEQEYLEEMKKIQENLLCFLENEENEEENFQNLRLIFEDFKINENNHKLKSALYLILNISNNHYRHPNFFRKIEQILQIFKDDIKIFFTNSEIFDIFKSNKRILLFLIEEKIIIFDDIIVQKIVNNEKLIEAKYPQYFSPEIKPFVNEKWFPKQKNSCLRKILIDEIKEELPDNFYEDRKIGENNNPICKLIRDDSIEDFITYINRNGILITKTIEISIYETNSYLLKYQNESITLIKYAAFFGSNQIFKYLRLNGSELTLSLWFYAIHGLDIEIIDFLKENYIEPDNDYYNEFFAESIKCHHNNVANFLLENYLQNENENDIIKCLKYYNFAFMPKLFDYSKLLYFLCKYDYYIIVNELMKNKDIDVNQTQILY